MRKSFWKRLLSFSAMTVVLLGTLAASVSASSGFFTPYNGYEYNYYKESVAAPVGYVLEKSLTAKEMGLDIPLSNSNDMSCSDGKVYVLDSGNSRILELNADLRVQNIYTGFVMPANLSASGEQEAVTFDGAEGFYVGDDGTFFIADTQNERILRVKDGVVNMVITKPDTKSIDAELPFYVRKVTVGSQGRIYALVESVNQGALVFDGEGNFLSFFGSNEVKKTAEVISKYVWRKFMSQEQLEASAQYTPVNMVNFDVDNRGFMVTVTLDTSETLAENTVRRLNYENSDVLNSAEVHQFGDYEWDRDRKNQNVTALSDIDVDPDGFYVMLDSTRGRTFIYSDTGEFVTEFGCSGEQGGTVSNATAVETSGGRIYILDAGKKCVHVFRPTDYVQKYRAALLSLDQGNYGQSLESWQELLDENTNNELVYYGMGRVYDEAKDYKMAMSYFRMAKDQEAYSFSFREYRKIFLQDNFLLLFGGAVVVIAALVILLKLAKRKLLGTGESAYSMMESKWLFPLYVQTHPADGFIQFKSRKNIRSWEMTFGFVIAWFLLEVLSFFGTGFIFNDNRISDFSLFTTLASTIVLYILFVVANWAVCTLIEGKGSLPEIMTTTSYALLPFLVTVLLNTILSNVFALEEQSFMTIITYIGLIWTGLVLFVGLSAIHEYSVGKTVVSLLLTVFGMAVIIFLVILFYTLITQTISFVVSIIQEISLRQ